MRFSSLGRPHFHGESNICILNFILIRTKRKKEKSCHSFHLIWYLVFIGICLLDNFVNKHFRVEDIVAHFYQANFIFAKKMVYLEGWN